MNPADGHDPCIDDGNHVASLPEPHNSFFSAAALQLLQPQPCKLLEADRPELFEVMAPKAAAVAVGSDELGWQALQPVTAQVDRRGLFSGMVVMPRAERCFVAVQLADGEQSPGLMLVDGTGSKADVWLPVLSLQIRPQVGLQESFLQFSPAQLDC